MKLTPSMRQDLRIGLLVAANEVGHYGLPLERLRIIAERLRFHNFPEEQLREEIQYLLDKGFLVAIDKPLSPEIEEWRITAAARDFLAKEGCA